MTGHLDYLDDSETKQLELNLLALNRLVDGTVKINEPMCNHTSWKIGGPAQIFVQPASTGDLQRVFTYARQNKMRVTIIGNGTNLLVSDGGIEGVVVQVGKGIDHLSCQQGMVIAGAGVKLASLAACAREYELAGFEFLAGIPGTVGGALVMNAGANNSCMADVVHKISTIDYQGNFKQYSLPDLAFSYRSSGLKSKSEVVVEAVFRGAAGDRDQIRKVTKKYLKRRKKCQPLEHPNAGSVFKNPPGDSAGRLIEMAGAKGLAVGDAQVSTKHANFFINRGQATAGEMLALIEHVQGLVFEEFGVELFLEVQLLGKH